MCIFVGLYGEGFLLLLLEAAQIRRSLAIKTHSDKDTSISNWTTRRCCSYCSSSSSFKFVLVLLDVAWNKS